MEKTYNPATVEDKWYAYWLEQDFFSSKPNPEKAPYTVVIPPPNVTGVLHMGHMLNNTIQDVLVRRARMQGKEACWVPGTDHASIATEAKVVKMLAEKGLNKQEIGREAFLAHAWEWKEKYGGIILEQLKKLGASCDWKRTRFTMEEDLSRSVIKVFVELYNKGLIYRGARMINWDPQGKTALSDEEVIYRQVSSKLYHVRYRIDGTEGEWLTIATTRPETILGDSAICVNPEDERYKHLVGKKAVVPMVNRTVPIIADAYVDMEFGTGCLKVTPAHDLNDYELGLKHKLEVIDVLNDDGSMSEAAQFYVGKDRFEARKLIVRDLEAEGLLSKTEELTNNVGFSERTDAVVEPRISTQWFMKMKEPAQPAFENVMNDTIRLLPPKFKNTYRHWMENVKDWCISRQLWWGHRIPAWYLPNGELVVAENAESALAAAQQIDPSISMEDLQQDDDVLDTWFSSWLWPMSVFNGINEPENPDFKYYYPTNDLVTAPEILFFWVARMIIAGYAFAGEKPFSNVYLTGIVRDKQRRKMSKSLGNSPDPLQLIGTYGADSIRVGMLFSSPAGNDLLFDEKLCEQGRNFCNKIWNALRLVKGWEVAEGLKQPDASKVSVEWFASRYQEVLAAIEDQYSKFRLSDALLGIYKLIWDDFCSKYLEMIKPAYGQPIDRATFDATIGFFDELMKVLHPFMPFISEEVWHQTSPRQARECAIVADYPQPTAYGRDILREASLAFEMVTQVLNIRNSKQIAKNRPLKLFVKTEQPEAYHKFEAVVKKLANLEAVEYVTSSPEETSAGFVLQGDECYLPLGDAVDLQEEREKVLKDIEYTKGSIKAAEKKLANERFVQNAPAAVVEKERKKLQDAQDKLAALQATLKQIEEQL